jgi:acyl-coenzyme A synthetase/AMP-(fatty) acid ligase
MNVSGHRIGTAEVESALTMHAAVAESACVQVPHDVKGNAIFAFVILRPGFAMDSKLQGELKSIVRQQVGPFAQPDTILEAPGLPKTRSGKIMRRILRKVLCSSHGVVHISCRPALGMLPRSMSSVSMPKWATGCVVSVIVACCDCTPMSVSL